MRTLALLVVIALPVFAQDGGAVLFVVDNQLEFGDAGIKTEGLVSDAPQVLGGDVLLPNSAEWQSVGEGCFLPTSKCITVGKETKRLQAENEELKKKPEGLKPIFTAAWVGFAAGIATALTGVGVGCQLAVGNPLCIQR